MGALTYDAGALMSQNQPKEITEQKKMIAMNNSGCASPGSFTIFSLKVWPFLFFFLFMAICEAYGGSWTKDHI